MHVLWNFLIRVKRLFGWPSWLPFLGLVELHRFRQAFIIYPKSKRLKVTVTDMQGFHNAYGFVVLIRFNLHDGFRLVVQFRADMSPCVFIILVLMQDGMNVYLPVVSPPHEFGYYFGGLAGRIDVIDEITDTINDDQSQVRYHADCLFRYCQSYFR